MNFAELGLNPIVLDSLIATGYTEPTPVQAGAIPAALEGQDLLVSSHTGSGKTAAFLLPTLSRMAENAPDHKPVGPRLLVLCPTRELALQVQKQAMTYGKGLRRMRTACLVGGAPFGPQFQALKVNPEVMIATPGRLMDHMERGRIDFSDLQTLVLDEADRMLDMGFIDDIESIVARLPASRQTMLFSATLDGVVGKLAQRMTRNAKRIEIVAVAENRADIDQRFLFADDFSHKQRLLDSLLRDESLTQALVFTATKKSAEELSESLLEAGFTAGALHGDMPQHKRNRTLQRLRDGNMRVLVATDVAARGIDVAGISHVINFDSPRQAEDYVHRIGRTGRAGRSGVAVTLIGGKDRGLLREIERYTGDRAKIIVIPGLEPRERSHSAKPEWSGKPRSGGWQGQDRKPAGPGRGTAGKSEGWKGRSDTTRPARSDGGWNKPDPRRGEAYGNTWSKPAPRKPEANGNIWVKPAARPPEKNGNTLAKPEHSSWGEPRKPAPRRDRQGW